MRTGATSALTINLGGSNNYAPTVLADATSKMQLTCEETFGPIAPLFRFDDCLSIKYLC